MSAIFVKQPNGRFCRYSSILDCVTDWNFTEDEVKRYLMKEYERKVNYIIENMKKGENSLDWTFDDVLYETEYNGVSCGNMTQQEFDDFVKSAYDPV